MYCCMEWLAESILAGLLNDPFASIDSREWWEIARWILLFYFHPHLSSYPILCIFSVNAKFSFTRKFYVSRVIHVIGIFPNLIHLSYFSIIKSAHRTGSRRQRPVCELHRHYAHILKIKGHSCKDQRSRSPHSGLRMIHCEPRPHRRNRRPLPLSTFARSLQRKQVKERNETKGSSTFHSISNNLKIARNSIFGN